MIGWDHGLTKRWGLRFCFGLRKRVEIEGSDAVYFEAGVSRLGIGLG